MVATCAISSQVRQVRVIPLPRAPAANRQHASQNSSAN